LDEGKLRIGPKKVAVLWFTWRAKDIPPGRYQGHLLLRVAEENISAIVDLSVTVLPGLGMGSPPPQVNTWSYLDDITVRKFPQQAVQDLCDHGTNVFVIPHYELPWPQFDSTGSFTRLDFKKFDAILRLLAGKGKLLLWPGFEYAQSQKFKSPRGPKWKSAAWERVFAQWLEQIVAHLDSLGWGYSDFAIYPVDEGYGNRLRIFREVALSLRKIDPSIQIYLNPGENVPWSSVRAVAPWVDIWQPHLGHFSDLEKRSFLRCTGKPIWTYVCKTNARALSSYNYYRLLPWRTWNYGLQGCGFWSYCVSEGDPWNDSDGRYGEASVIYKGDQGIIGSRRWEAFRQGLDDCRLLKYCLTLASSRDKASRLVEQAVQDVLKYPNEETRAERWRGLMLKELGRGQQE